MNKPLHRFSDFYPFYLSQHQHPMCRALHYVGSTLVLLLIALAISLGNVWVLLLLPIVGYGPAWLGHYAFEHNRPATFTHPIYSFLADWLMFTQWVKSLYKIKPK